MNRLLRLAPLAVLALAAAATAHAASAAAPALAPPVAKRDPKTTVLHGETWVDEYHWLRNKGTPEVEEYLRAELAYAEAYMEPTKALQQKIYDEMLSRIQQTDSNVPYLDRGYFYYSRTEEGKQYPIYARRKGALEAPEEVILDVNKLAEGKKFMSAGSLSVSPDGRLLAYRTDETGFRQFRLQVKDLSTGQLRPETAERVTSLVWAEDGKTLLYAVEHPVTKRSHQAYRWTLGSPQPQLFYEEADERFSVYVGKSRDRRHLFLSAGSLTTSEIRFTRSTDPAAEWTLIAPREQDHEYDVESHGDTLWIRTNDKGRNFRLVTAPVASPGRESWREVVPHRDDVMLEIIDVARTSTSGSSARAASPGWRHRAGERQVARGGAFPSRPLHRPQPERRVRHQAVPLPLRVADDLTVDVRLRPLDPPSGSCSSRRRCSAATTRRVIASSVTHATATDGTRVPMSLVLCGRTSHATARTRSCSAPTAPTARPLALLRTAASSVCVDRGVIYAVAHHPRRRRARQALARRGAHDEEEEHLHRLHRRRRAPGRRAGTPARSGWPSRAAAPAGC